MKAFNTWASLFLAVLLIFFSPLLSAYAEGNNPASSPVSSASSGRITREIFQERLVLAGKFHDVRPVRPMIENAIERTVSRLPLKDQIPFRKAVDSALDYDAFVEESVRAMASVFTVAELEAMIAYYGSEAGRSSMQKMSAYGDLMAPKITGLLDEALMVVRTGPLPDKAGSR